MGKRKSRGESEELYRNVFRNSSVSMWLQDITGLRTIIEEWKTKGVSDVREFLAHNPSELRRAVHAIEVVDVNDATLDMYETPSVSDLLGPLDLTLDLDHPEIVSDLTDDIVAIAENRERIEKESWAITPSGRRLDVSIRAYAPPESSEFPFMLVNVENITDRKHLEQGLQWERRQFHMLLDSATDRIYFKDRTGRYTLVNQTVATDFGFERPDQLVGVSSYDCLEPSFAEEVRREERRIIEGGEPVADREERERGPDGTLRWYSTTKSVLRDTAGEIVGIVGITRNITSNKLLEQDRIRIERLEGLGQLASGIAHRFNNINAAAMGYLEMVMRSENLPQNLRGYLVGALEAILSSADITSTLQVLTSASQSRKTAIHLESIVRSLLPEIEEQTRLQAVMVDTKLEKTRTVECAPDSMEFVVRSVVSNALHALLERPQRTLTIRTYPSAYRSHLEIADTGRGLTEGELAKVFTPFYTTKGEWADPSTPQAKVKGIGLSLAVCRSLVSEQGGTLEIESVRGTGTTVRITLPTNGDV